MGKYVLLGPAQQVEARTHGQESKTCRCERRATFARQHSIELLT
jgi:hypothetical protein